MPDINRIAAILSAADRDAVLAAVATIRGKLPGPNEPVMRILLTT
jgi:hypothetical protein